MVINLENEILDTNLLCFLKKLLEYYRRNWYEIWNGKICRDIGTDRGESKLRLNY